MQYSQYSGDIYRPYFEEVPLQFEILPEGTWLYHASENGVDQSNPNSIPIPNPTECPDTGKRGVYFSARDPFLSEVRSTETLHDMTITCFRTLEDIPLNIGKYGFTRNYTGRYALPHWTVPDDDNYSHIDYEIGSLDSNVVEYNHGPEVFLNDIDINKILYVSTYHITTGECIRKWYKQTWFESYVNKVLRPRARIPESQISSRTLKHNDSMWYRSED